MYGVSRDFGELGRCTREHVVLYSIDYVHTVILRYSKQRL